MPSQPNLFDVDWSKLRPPADDGGARHLCGLRLPLIALPSTNGHCVDVGSLGGRSVLYTYPMTGRPGVPLPDGWDGIAGARGCTPQSCAFRDHHAELLAAGADRVYGLSTQDAAYQREAAERLHLSFALLSDAEHLFVKALGLPTFEVDGLLLTKRMAIVADEAIIVKVFYPVFPPDRNAAEVLAWLKANPK